MTRRNKFIHTPILIAGLTFGVSLTAAGQGPPAIPGVTGTLATKGTVEREYAGAKKIIDNTVGSAARAIRGTTVTDPLEGLREGSTVLVHYVLSGRAAAYQEDAVRGQNFLNVTEGTVASIDRSRERIAIRFQDGQVVKYRLTNRATVDAGKNPEKAAAGAARVMVSYRDEDGIRVEHVFKKMS